MRFTFKLSTPAIVVAALLPCAAFVGCGKPGNSLAGFQLNLQGDDPLDYSDGGDDEKQQAVREFNRETLQFTADALEAMFGTPDEPFVFTESGLDLRKIRMASGPVGGRPAAEQKKSRDAWSKKQQELLTKVSELEATAAAQAKTLADQTAQLGGPLKEAQDQLARAKTANDAPAVAAAQKLVADRQAALAEQVKPAQEAKNKADAELAVQKGEIADLDLLVKASFVPQKGLYRQHCAHCHGVTGDGAGPTAAFLYPYPRDYRDGIFKFKSTELAAKPTTADLRRILVDGIPDTAMPTVGLLPSDEIDALVEYVKYLSMRGEAEKNLKLKYNDLRQGISDQATLAEAKAQLAASRTMLVQDALSLVAEAWKNADEAEASQSAPFIKPAEDPSRGEDPQKWLSAGRELFVGNVGQCFSCHGSTGLGDGRKPSDPLYDFWNKPKGTLVKALADAQEKDDDKAADTAARLLGTYLLPVEEQQPRNLRLNRYRFGRDRVDIYRRIYTGIAGTEMPGAKGKLTDQQIWQLVDYVRTLPFFDDNGAVTQVDWEQLDHAAHPIQLAHGPPPAPLPTATATATSTAPAPAPTSTAPTAPR